jgi:6,7-dimethyl-8-ribityllumazine synthase
MTQPMTQTMTEPVKVAIAVAQFNATVTEQLLAGCQHALVEGGVAAEDIDVVHVPGAWELPLACRWLADADAHQAIIALGAVVRGETPHFDFISAECARGLGEVALSSRIPVLFGVLTPNTPEQAYARSDPERGNKGGEVGRAAVQMMQVRHQLTTRNGHGS